ncbi:uncharacterized protein LOC125075582 [Vanessa atalanta]|uniref:uncharacterized protein LOC125075582 n=1 Tax=Vanessa atalanta TaxID=42275 RepID=UPI001FCD7C80|nr:uncharacterized protein LOC125075582 [Vanessa atalanta]
MELGEQKPSQLLRRMRDLARDKIPDDTLRILWQGHLPSSVRAGLAVTEVKELENLAVIADKIVETSKPMQIAEIAHVKPHTSTDTDRIMAEIAKLRCEVAELKRTRPRFQHRRDGGRTRSTSRNRSRDPSSQRPRRTPESPDWLCYYHHRFRARAIKCAEPCAWRKHPEN